MGTRILWLLASGVSVCSLSGRSAHWSVVSPLSPCGPTYGDVPFRANTTDSCAVMWFGGPFGPLLESYSIERSLSGWMLRDWNKPVTYGHRGHSHRLVGLASPYGLCLLLDCPSSDRLGRTPIGLSPSSPRRRRSVNPMNHKRCLSFGALYVYRRNLMRLCALTHSKIIKNCTPHSIKYKQKVHDDRNKN
jgi:hypothetical protein